MNQVNDVVERVKNYNVIVLVNGEYYDCLDSFGGDKPNENSFAQTQAIEYADAYRGDDEWFNEFTDYEYTHADDTWEIVVEEN